MNKASRKPSSKSVPFEAIFPGVSQDVAIGSSSTQCANPLQANTSVVALVATVACFIAIGSDPTAAANTSMYLPANTRVIIGVPTQGDTGIDMYIAVIEASSSGTLYITEGA